MWALLAAGALGLVAGVLAGLFGVGGGILFVPTLALVLGLTQLHAEATSLLAILPTAAAGAWRQRTTATCAGGPPSSSGVAAIAGVEAGVQIAEALPETRAAAAVRPCFCSASPPSSRGAAGGSRAYAS